jgi:YD repeat-containing protein
MPQRGVYPNGSYTFDKLEAINKLNGILTYSIPITSLPLGRGGMTVPINLVYSSALSDTRSYVAANSQGGLQTYSVVQTSPWGGWFFSGFKYSLYKQSAGSYSCASGPFPPFRLVLVMPDGAHHALKLYGQSDNNGDSSYWFDPQTGYNACSGQTLASPLTYYTSDGSYLRVQINTPGDQWSIYLPDGAQASGSGIGINAAGPMATSIQDRNGNKVSIVPDNGAGATVLTDDLGRSVTITSSTVTQTGFGGSPNPLTWTLGPTTSYTIQANCSSPGPQGCGQYTGGGPAWLQIPSDTGTLKYTFGYDPTNGALNSVTLPTGATTAYTYVGGPLVGFGVTHKEVTWTDSSDGGSSPRTEIWTYNYSSTSLFGGTCSPHCTAITRPDGGQQTTYFHAAPGNDPLAGLSVREVEPDGSDTEYLYYQNRPLGGQGSDSSNPYIYLAVRTAATSGSPASAAVELRTIDKNGNLTVSTDYDWIPYSSLAHDGNGYLSGFSGGSALKAITSSYSVSTPNAGTGTESISDNANAYWNPAAPKLRDLMKRSVTTGSGIGAATEYSYDGNGNQTQERHWDSTKAASLPGSLDPSNSSITGYTFDSHGNLTDVTDPVGNATHYTV